MFPCPAESPILSPAFAPTEHRRRRSARRRAAAAALACLAVLALLGRGGPGRALAQEGFVPDSAAQAESLRADSLRQAYDDSVATADSLAALGFEEDELGASLGSSLSLLGRPKPQHPFSYSTTYGTLRSRRSWDQSLDFYVRLRGLAFANRTSASILEDPDVKRNTRNRQTQFELGYVMPQGLISGVRVSITRNSDLIGIRQRNNIVRDGDELAAFTRYERTLAGLPITANANFGAVRDRQPEFSRQGRQLAFDGATRGRLFGTLSWNVAGTYRNDRLRSEAPSTEGVFSSLDRTTERTAAAGLNWNPVRWLTLDLKGNTRRGTLQRPETLFDLESLDERVVQEQVRTDADNGNLTATLRLPYLGTNLTLGGGINNTEIVYAADSTRDNVALARTFNLSATDTLVGLPVTVKFTNGTTENDYTKRSDGYLQEQWRRQADFQTNRRINARTSTDLRTGISLESRRYSRFRPSGPSSFPPSDQDLLRASGALRADYRPLENFTTGLEGQVDLTRTINLAATSSLNNTDQVGYQVIWRWTFNPTPIWSVSQNNSAGAQEITYPFASERDQLSFIYQIRTASALRLTPKWNVEMNYGLRYQSRGSYRERAGGRRLFGKSGGADQYDLLLRTTYQFFSWLNFEINGQRFVTEGYSLPSGNRRVDTQSWRRTLFGGFNATYKFRSGATLTGTLRRNMTWDSSQLNTQPPSPATVREDDYWQISGSFRTDLDL